MIYYLCFSDSRSEVCSSVLFFKQKTAYELRISDWSSDVCSSDLWLLNHERFGPALRAWRDQRAISRSAKRAACIGMTVGYGLFCVSVRPSPLLALVVAAGLTACAAYVLSRPQPRNGI